MPGPDRFLRVFQEWIEVFMHHSMRRFIHYARQNGLSMSMIGTLFHLHQQESAGVTGLGEHLGVTSAAASQMLDRLVQLELIQRSEDPDDRRAKQVILTRKGCQVLEDGLQARQSWIVDLAESLSAAEKDQIASALALMIDKANLVETSPTSDGEICG